MSPPRIVNVLLGALVRCLCFYAPPGSAVLLEDCYLDAATGEHGARRIGQRPGPTLGLLALRDLLAQQSRLPLDAALPIAGDLEMSNGELAAFERGLIEAPHVFGLGVVTFLLLDRGDPLLLCRGEGRVGLRGGPSGRFDATMPHAEYSL